MFKNVQKLKSCSLNAPVDLRTESGILNCFQTSPEHLSKKIDEQWVLLVKTISTVLAVCGHHHQGRKVSASARLLI